VTKEAGFIKTKFKVSSLFLQDSWLRCYFATNSLQYLGENRD